MFTSTATRTEALDYVNRLLMFDETGFDTDTAQAIMIRRTITADELNARILDTDRAPYRPIR